jgi:anti-sigma regulatory factor (Ser/Thr protein kinase)
MPTPHSSRFDARLEPFAAVHAFVEQFCAGVAVDPGTSAALTLIVEELFANSVQHGYRGSEESAPEWPIWLTLGINDDRVEAVYEDAAPAYNPFENIAVPDYSGPVESWRMGGLGVLLVARHASDLDYERRSGRNRIRFTVPMNNPAA